MGWFVQSRYNEKRLNNELNLDKLKPEEILRRVQHRIYESMSRQGTPKEVKYLELIFQDFDIIKPSKMSNRKLLSCLNLLIGITNLFSAGKLQTEIEEQNYYWKKLKAVNPKYDPRANELFMYADFVYKIHNERANKLRDNLCNIDEKNDYIVLRGKKLTLKKGLKDKALKNIIKSAQTISYNEAMEKANRQSSIFTSQEFDVKEIDLQNAYKNFRSKTVKKKTKSGMQIK